MADTPRHVIPISREELKSLMRSAVSDAFRDVGIITHDDDAVDDRRRDFQFLHDLRRTSESTKAKVGSALLLAAASGFVWLLLSGFRLWTRQ